MASCYSRGMRILGIDPGTATTGYGLVSFQGGKAQAEDFGCILTSKLDNPSQRLHNLHQSMLQLLDMTKPDVVAIEKLYFNTNVTTAIGVGQARGVILLAIEQHGLPIAEYTPLQVKSAVCGYGMAKKPQVQQMIQVLLKLKSAPKPDDAADALAIALCHNSMATIVAK